MLFNDTLHQTHKTYAAVERHYLSKLLQRFQPQSATSIGEYIMLFCGMPGPARLSS